MLNQTIHSEAIVRAKATVTIFVKLSSQKIEIDAERISRLSRNSYNQTRLEGVWGTQPSLSGSLRAPALKVRIHSGFNIKKAARTKTAPHCPINFSSRFRSRFVSDRQPYSAAKPTTSPCKHPESQAPSEFQPKFHPVADHQYSTPSPHHRAQSCGPPAYWQC